MAKEETKLVLFLKSIGISGRYKGFYYSLHYYNRY